MICMVQDLHIAAAQHPNPTSQRSSNNTESCRVRIQVFKETLNAGWIFKLGEANARNALFQAGLAINIREFVVLVNQKLSAFFRAALVSVS